MIDTVPPPDATLPELLAARARHASDARLAVEAVIGALVVIASLAWHGPGWHLVASLAACVLAFGVWGIADRELGERASSRATVGTMALRALRVVAVVVGAIAVFVVFATGLGIALGRMIS